MAARGAYPTRGGGTAGKGPTPGAAETVRCRAGWGKKEKMEKARGGMWKDVGHHMHHQFLIYIVFQFRVWFDYHNQFDVRTRSTPL